LTSPPVSAAVSETQEVKTSTPVEMPAPPVEQPVEPALKVKPLLPEEKESFLKGSTIRVLLIVIPLVAGLIYIGTQLNQSPSRFEVANIPVTEEEKENVALQKEPEPEKIQTQQLNLRAVASGTTWMRIITDKRDTAEHNLRQGDQVEWKAFSGFQLRIGRAHAVRFFLNGNDLGELGRDTQLVWEMLITSNGIEAKELRTRTDLPQQSAPAATQPGAN
jgi:hypothetical protein